jgi:hypothetical protein
LQAYVHAPLAHAGFAFATLVEHAFGDPHAPPEQLSTLVPEHVVWPGAHSPEHAPPTHVWFVHAAAPLHVPSVWQVSTPLFEHMVCEGAHVPEHAPPTHAWFEHGFAFCQVPVGLHVCGCCPLHWICPCPHTP